MKPCDVYQWKFSHGNYPAVIVSPAVRCDNQDIDTVNVAGCSSKVARRTAEAHEPILDRGDSL